MLCQVGDVLKFRYGRGEKQSEHIVRILGVRDTRQHPVLPATKAANPIPRSRYLLVAQESGGLIRSFYTDEVAPDAKRFGFIGRVLLYVQGVRV